MGRKNKNKGGNRNRNPPQNQQKTQKQPIYSGPPPTFQWEKSDSTLNLNEEIKSNIDLWTSRLSETVGNEYEKHIFQQIENTAKQLSSVLNHDQIKNLLEFYTKHPNVYTINETWKNEITKGNYVSYGFKVCNASGKRMWGGDDGVYRSNPILQEYLPRGCVIVENTSNHLSSIGIFGNRKFYGKSSGDDDESDLTSDTIKRGSYSQFLISNKANGESCHISICPMDDNVWIIGSKNRKIAVSSKNQIKLYKDEPFYSMAIEMAEVFFNYLDSMGIEKVNQLKDLLKFTKWTLNFEFEYPEHQHIVPLLKPQLVLIGCSGIHIPSGIASHPILGCSIARYFNFPSVLEDLTIHPKENIDNICYNIAREWNTEGSVLILLDDNHNVIDFVKVKSWWYILLRAIREKIRRIKDIPTIQVACMGIIKRIKTLKNSMNIDESYSKCFIKYGIQFAEWISEIDKTTNTMPKIEIAMDKYPILWLDFLKSKNLPIDSTIIDPFKNEKDNDETNLKQQQQQQEEDEYNSKYSRSSLPLLILLQGIPGIGKSYLAKKLSEKLNNEGISTKDVAQDDFVADVGLKNSGKACQKYIRDTLIKKEYDCIILARNNANAQQYSNYVDFDSDGLCRVLFICPKELSTRLEEAVLMSVASVLYRQSNSNELHPTDDMEKQALASLPLKFFGAMKIHPSAFPISIMNENSINIPNPQKFNQILSRFKSKGFRSPDLSSDDIRVLGLDNINDLKKFIDCRRDIDKVTNDCYTFIKHIISKNTPLPGTYFAINLNSESSNQLVSFAQTLFDGGDIPNNWNVYSDHVTLMHSNSYYTSPKHISMWEKLSEHIGIQAQIKPVLLLVNDKLATLKVSCSTVDGLSLDKFVISKMPHVTIACAPGVSAMSSIKELEDCTTGVELNEPIMFGSINLVELQNS